MLNIPRKGIFNLYMYKYLAVYLVLLLLLSSCKFNPNLQDKGSDYLQGIWQENKVDYQDRLLQYTTHSVKFNCDSFYITFLTKSKVDIYPDSCYNKGVWTEFAKGGYVVQNDTLFLSGTFAKSDFKQKISGCFRNGQYLESFIIKKHSNDSLYLESLQQHNPIKLALQKKITCTPKPVK